MGEIKQYYDITEYSFNIGIRLNAHRLTMKRDRVMMLVRDYITDELNKLLDWTTMTSVFIDTIDSIYSCDRITNTIARIFNKNLSVLINDIVNDIHLESTSFIISKLVTQGRIVFLEIENCGDYRIVTHELRERGIDV